MTRTPTSFDAVLFDLDGVLTATSALHAAAWKQTFDAVLAKCARRTGLPQDPFDIERDYLEHVDGKPRHDGVRDLLHSRCIALPEGGPNSPAGEWSVHGIGNRKQELIERALADGGVDAFPGLGPLGRAAARGGRADGGRVLERELARRAAAPRASRRCSTSRSTGATPPARAARQARARRLPRRGRAARRRAGARGRGRGRARRRRRRPRGRVRPRDRRRARRRRRGAARGRRRPRRRRPRGAGPRCLSVSPGSAPPPGGSPSATSGSTGPAPPSPCSPSATATSACAGRTTRARPAHDPGVVLNGFHETWPIEYPEDAYGLARTGQTTVNATDGSVIRLLVDGEPLDLETARVLRCERVLDMASGVLLREVEYETARGKRVLVRSRRLASLADRHLVAIDYEVVALDADLAVALSSELVTHAPSAGADDPRRGKGFATRCSSRTPRARRGPARCCSSPPAGAACSWCAGSSTWSTAPPGRPRTTTRRRSSSRRSWRPASRCGCRSSSPTTGARRATRAGRAHARPRRRVRLRGGRGRASRGRRGLLGAQRHRDRGRARRPAGGPLQPLPAAPGDRPHGRRRRARQGRHRPRLRGPLLLGHRDLRRPVPRPHDARVGAAGCSSSAARTCPRRASARARSGTRGALFPWRTINGARGLRVVRVGNRAVPHQRRHRARAAPVQPRHRRPRLHARPGRRGGLRDGEAVDGARVLPRAAASASTPSPAPTSTRPSSTTTPTRT